MVASKNLNRKFIGWKKPKYMRLLVGGAVLALPLTYILIIQFLIRNLQTVIYKIHHRSC